MIMNRNILFAILSAIAITGNAQHTEYFKYGNFNNWITRTLKESAVIGGKSKTVYEIGPTQTISGNVAYVPKGNSPWATSNVYAKVSGVVKTSNAVYPYTRKNGDLCAKLCTQIEQVKVLGVVNMDVMVSGSIFLGRMFEPITSTKNPYSKMEMGIPYTKKPDYLVFDYKLEMPNTNTRVKSTGFGSKKTLQGRDSAMVFVMLQKRWEDESGNLHALRVGTAGELFSSSTDWQNGHKLKIHYGDCSKSITISWLQLHQDKSKTYCAKNSKGKVVPVIEDGWGSANDTPTHMILMFSSGSGEAYVGTEGLTFYVDNVGVYFKN
jgi:hypothetical protein